MLYKEQREAIMTKKGVTTMRKSSLFVLVFGSMTLAMSAAIAHAQSCAPPPSGMVAWWLLNETSGATATDIVGGFNGTAQPGPIGTTGSNPGPTTWLPTSFPPGMVGSSLFFGGKRHIRVPHNPALDPGTGSFAVDFWFIWGGGSGPIIQKMLPSGEGWGIFVVQNSTNPSAANIELRWKFASGISMPVLSLPIVSNQWYHLFAEMERNIVAPALSVLALNGTGFVNASLNVPPTETIATNADLLIGGDGINPGARIAVDEIEIFSRSLTVQEVQSIFNAGKAGKCKPSNKAEICIFKFNDLNGNGQKEANEPPLAGWQFNVNPAPLPPSTNPVTTGQQGGRCFGVSAPGTYTITESVQAGWTPKTSNPQTVNISPGQLVNVYFGNQQCVQPPSGMVAWYRMDGNANDFGGSNNPSATNAISFVAGKDGQGVTFGSGGYIDIPHSPALANQQFTIDAWVKPQGPGPNNDFWGSVIVQKGLPLPAGHTAQSVSLWWSSNQQKFLFGIGTSSPPTNVAVSSNTFPATNTNWYHVAATYDGSTMKLYVNGNLEASKPFTSSITYDPSIPWTIGSTAAPYRDLGAPRTFNGVIDEVEIFNRALSQAEIQAIYKSGKCKFKKVFDPTQFPTN
ncbi:LamG-like jellyroll fold domain-containing protein [Thermostichus sp. MS-CIW-15]